MLNHNFIASKRIRIYCGGGEGWTKNYHQTVILLIFLRGEGGGRKLRLFENLDSNQKARNPVQKLWIWLETEIWIWTVIILLRYSSLNGIKFTGSHSPFHHPLIRKLVLLLAAYCGKGYWSKPILSFFKITEKNEVTEWFSIIKVNIPRSFGPNSIEIFNRKTFQIFVYASPLLDMFIAVKKKPISWSDNRFSCKIYSSAKKLGEIPFIRHGHFKASWNVAKI